ncbi:PRKR-interacting protein 1 like, partial [Pseudolycoriella hygida]
MEDEKIEMKSEEKVKTKFVARTPVEAQRIKLEKLMSDPTKPVLIPTTKQKKDFANAIPSFIRNVMGSSAGAGSGEFHVYRHLRRKEYARQKYIQQKSKQETLDEEYQQKLEDNRLQSEQKTSKKRAKRLKKKQNAKNKAKMPKIDQLPEQSKSESEDEEEDTTEQVNAAANEKSATDSTVEIHQP